MIFVIYYPNDGEQLRCFNGLANGSSVEFIEGNCYFHELDFNFDFLSKVHGFLIFDGLHVFVHVFITCAKDVFVKLNDAIFILHVVYHEFQL